MSLVDVAREHQRLRDALADKTARHALRLWRSIDPAMLDAGWDRIAGPLASLISAAQVTAARQAAPYLNAVADAVGEDRTDVKLVPELFGGATREGREVAPEAFGAVTETKRLISRGSGVPAAFQAGAGFMSVIAATMVADAGRSADKALTTGRGILRSVRVVSAGACSRCAILAGVTGYRENFQRHPRCRCTSMPIYGSNVPDGFYGSPEEYFESLSADEQARVFTKAGAEAVRLGASPISVVNARRGMYTKQNVLPNSAFGPARLRQIQIGTKADGSPLMVYATAESTTARSAWARSAGSLRRVGDDRYRRTTMVRLMPEQIMSMAGSQKRAIDLLKRYGYIR